uniref:BHLH domain-containing protein n=1 Tax=Caenorhabditis japonica TaxID=281687 RepID=A0A8R1I528_CAEJA
MDTLTSHVCVSKWSTRGASKQRRDQINVEIQKLRDLLPLSDLIKDRLFQLQVMSLGCIFIRKHRYQQTILQPMMPLTPPMPRGIDICKALRGFMLMVTRSGKILHVSDNASEYLGHSVEEIMCQGDSIYDLVDGRDHGAVQAELASGPPAAASFPEERVFICRLNLARTAKRQLQYHKISALSFSPTGRHLISGGDDCILHVYSIPPTGDESPDPTDVQDSVLEEQDQEQQMTAESPYYRQGEEEPRSTDGQYQEPQSAEEEHYQPGTWTFNGDDK